MYIWAIVGFYFVDDTFKLDAYDDEGNDANEN